jgi:hypothetical protein
VGRNRVETDDSSSQGNAGEGVQALAGRALLELGVEEELVSDKLYQTGPQEDA